MNPNICHDRKLIFVHNPKAAGTSFIKWLGFDGRINHGFPSYNTPHELWNKYTVVVCVRDPIDRAFSLYRFLTHESYQGVLTSVYPDIHSWKPKKLFDVIINEQLVFLAWQYKYVQHFHTNKPPDFVLKVEDLKVRNLARKLKIKKPFPRENTARSKRFVDVSEDIYLGLVDHFKVDYLLFDYKPKPYHSYMDGQLEAA
jgi:Sulfotransferase family